VKIAVCVAQVVDPEQPLEVSPRAPALDEAGLTHSLNAADAYALEAALLVRDQHPETDITALSVGRTRCEAALRAGLAQGVDRAVLLCDDAFEGSDTLATARILAAAVRRVEPELVLCGARSTDGSTGQVGPQLAELLGMPVLMNVVSLELADDGHSILAQRRVGQGYRLLGRASLPAVCAVETGANPPRYPRLRSILQSQRASIERWGLEDLNLRRDEVGAAGSAVRVLSLSPPPPDTRGLTAPPSDLPGEQRWQMVITGGMEQREGGPVEGRPEELADRVMRFLEERSYL
jgi:electron transfer flavoprotein alpha/beta subunit